MPPSRGKRPAPTGKRPAKGKAKPTKGRTKQRKPAKRRRRRLRIKLGLREKVISEGEDEYVDQVGWTVHENVLDDFEMEDSDEPQIITHQCSMCGSTMQIPKPKRDRYKVLCAYPECGHSDAIGL